MIDSTNYVSEVLKTESNDMNIIMKRLTDEKVVRLLHSFMGLCTETGELMDVIKKYIFYGKPIDEINLKEEVGDVSWYIGIAIDVLKTTMNEILEKNINKLKIRYPEKFTELNAINRDIDKELEVFECK